MPASIPEDINELFDKYLDDVTRAKCAAKIITCTTQEDGDCFINQFRHYRDKQSLFKQFAEYITNPPPTPENRGFAETKTNQSFTPKSKESPLIPTIEKVLLCIRTLNEVISIATFAIDIGQKIQNWHK